jgi:hypothetical protein
VQWSNCCTQSNGAVPPSGSITGSTIIGTSFLRPVQPLLSTPHTQLPCSCTGPRT